MGITTGQPGKAEDFINEAERNADPSLDEGKVVKLGARGKIEAVFNDFLLTKDTVSSFDGSVTPKPVTIISGGRIAASNAVDQPSFSGFSDTNTSIAVPSRIDDQNVGNGTQSYTAPAGTKRCLVIVTVHRSNAGSGPSSITWNGTPLINNVNEGSTTIRTTIWSLALGDSETDETFDLVFTGSSGSTLRHRVITYVGINQTTPVLDFGSDPVSSGTMTVSLTGVSSGIIVGGATTQGSVLTPSAPAVALDSTFGCSVAEIAIADAVDSMVWSNPSSNATATAIFLNPEPTTANLYYQGIIGGFTGLTVNAPYYVQDDGTIDDTPGTNTVYVGRAYSATEIRMDTTLPSRKGRAHGNGTTSDKGNSGTFVDIVVDCGFRPGIIRGCIGVYAGSQADHFDFGSYLVSEDTYRSAGINFTGTSGIVGREHTMTFIDISDSGFTVRMTQTNASPDTTRFWYEAEE